MNLFFSHFDDFLFTASRINCAPMGMERIKVVSLHVIVCTVTVQQVKTYNEPVAFFLLWLLRVDGAVRCWETEHITPSFGIDHLQVRSVARIGCGVKVSLIFLWRGGKMIVRNSRNELFCQVTNISC